MAVVTGDVHMLPTRALRSLGERLPGVPLFNVLEKHYFSWNGGEDQYTLADQPSCGRDVAACLGIHRLLDEAVTLGGTRYLGGMLWIDFRLGTHSLTHGMRSA